MKQDDDVRFSAAALEYDINSEIVTATGDVRMYREGDRLRADRVEWNRKTGKVMATGNIAVTNPGGDVAYGDSIELTMRSRTASSKYAGRARQGRSPGGAARRARAR